MHSRKDKKGHRVRNPTFGLGQVRDSILAGNGDGGLTQPPRVA